MAFSQGDLDTVNAAISSSVLEVRYPDGSVVRYQDLASLLRAKAQIEAELSTTGTKIVRQIRPIIRSGW